jgi:hypothetical protein
VNIDVIVGVAGTAAAVVVGLWPKLAALLPNGVKPAPAKVTYQQAMSALAVVRGRLVATGGVSETASKAIEAVTLALVEGSDK